MEVWKLQRRKASALSYIRAILRVLVKFQSTRVGKSSLREVVVCIIIDYLDQFILERKGDPSDKSLLINCLFFNSLNNVRTNFEFDYMFAYIM